MSMRRLHVVDSKILVLGFAFKENCPDLRNTRVIDIVNTLKDYNASVDIYDPWIDQQEACEHYGVNCIAEPGATHYDAIILAVAHNEFVELGADAIKAWGKTEHVLFDVKCVLPPESVDARL